MIAAVLVALVAAGCGSNGRELRDPPPGATAAPITTISASTVTVAPEAFALSSPDVDFAGVLPEASTCDGGTPPSFSWSTPFPGTTELALVVRNDVDRSVHWLITGIPSTARSVIDGVLPPGAVSWPTTSGQSGWDPPCPDEGTVDGYTVTLYPMTRTPELPTEPGADPDAVVAALDATGAVPATYIFSVSGSSATTTTGG